ncbi:hypothetical protein HAX54_018004, partial [Datura stramonium]|nr:hypothetical protein [Datura stramonium]
SFSIARCISPQRIHYKEKWTSIVGPLQRMAARQNPIPLFWKIFFNYVKGGESSIC